MEYIFICKECGNIQKYDNGQGTLDLKCNTCHGLMDWKNSYPPISALDFINSARDLLEQSKKCDKENLSNQYEIIKKDCKYNIDKTLLDKYNNQYQSILEKYPDNDDTLWLEIDDKFEEVLCSCMDTEQAITILSAIRVFRKNYFRKPYIILVASLIEQLFNDYFREVINKKLSEKGRRVFLEKYNTAGIQSALDIIDSFLDESLHTKMDQYSKGFYDKWTSLRNLRNSIIHSNNQYVTKVKVSNISKLIDESFFVFSNLKSEIYKMNRFLGEV